MKSKSGNTPLHEAARNNNSLNAFMSAIGANVVKERNTDAVIIALIKAGADVAEKNKDGVTPLELAKKNPAVTIPLELTAKNPAIVTALAAIGSDEAAGFGPWVKVDWEFVTADEIRALIAASADVTAKNDDDFTPLHLAAYKSPDPAVITAMIDSGANIAAKTHSGETPLHAGVVNTNPAVIAALINGGADVTAKTDLGLTPLHYAASHSINPAVITVLIEHGADVNALDHNGCPPLLGAKLGNIEALKHFGAKPLFTFTKCKTG